MQLQGMLFILLMLIIVPILVISSNDTAFFIIFALIMVIASFKSINNNLFNNEDDSDDSNIEFLEEIEEQLNIDINKFGAGLKVVKDLAVIIFFIYCNFYLNTIWLKVILTLLILYWVTDLKSVIHSMKESLDVDSKSTIKTRFISLIMNLSCLLIIAVTTFNKFLYKK